MHDQTSLRSARRMLGMGWDGMGWDAIARSRTSIHADHDHRVSSMTVTNLFVGLCICLGIVCLPLAVFQTRLCLRLKHHHTELWTTLGQPMPGFDNRTFGRVRTFDR